MVKRTVTQRLCDAPSCTTPRDDVQRIHVALPEGKWAYDLCADHRAYLHEWVTDMQKPAKVAFTRPVVKASDLVVERKKRGATRR